jgi:hypothetical protein
VSSFECNERERRDQVTRALRVATRLTPGLFSRVATGAGTQFAAGWRANQAERLAQLVLAEAWTDSSLLLIEIELPLWRVRRLLYDGGEWMCSLSRYPGLPVEIDPAADGRHGTMPIAVLLSFVEAKGLATAAEFTRTPSIPRAKPAFVAPACCDNFV